MKTQAQLSKEVVFFNKTYTVGEKVNLRMDDGSIKEVTVACPASILGGHSAVGWFAEISGCYQLDRVIY